MEKRKEIIIDVTPEIIVKERSPLCGHKEEFIRGVEVGFDFVEKGFDLVGRLAKSVGLGR